MNVHAAMMLAVVIGCGATSAWAASPAQETIPKRDAIRPHTETGLVMAVDAAKGKLSVKDESGRIRKFVAKRAKIGAAGGKTLSLADIAIGDEVSVAYTISYKGREASEVLRLHKAAKK